MSADACLDRFHEIATRLKPVADPVRLLVLDADGVLTDGSIQLDDPGVETKRFHVRDGFGIRLWLRMGFDAAIITGRAGAALRHRARELGIQTIYDGVTDKAEALRNLAEKAVISPSAMAYLGDDWPDLAAMRLVGLPLAVADAEPEVLATAAWITPRAGGVGAVRDAVHMLLTAKGLIRQAFELSTAGQGGAVRPPSGG